MLLSSETSEFAVIAEKFFKTMPNAEILSIERIQNHELWQKYSDRAQQVRSEPQACNEKLLFHGTSTTILKRSTKEIPVLTSNLIKEHAGVKETTLLSMLHFQIHMLILSVVQT